MVVELSGEIPFGSKSVGTWEIVEICRDFGPCRSLTLNHCYRTTKAAMDLKILVEVVLTLKKVLLKFGGDRSRGRRPKRWRESKISQCLKFD